MVVRLSIKQRYAILCFTIGGVIIYQFTRRPPEVERRMSRMEGLRANSSQFTLEGEPFRILGGSIHYFRVPRAYWEDRLLKMRACGLNTLTTYVPWNLHEPERGVFNFQDQLDLEAYLTLAAKLGLWVILRPGPYICAEWDLGGLPSWLLRDENMRLRTTYPGFTEAVDSFFDQLLSRVAPYQFSRGGPVVAVQVENEYGSYAKDPAYMAFIKEALVSRGITELLLTSDTQDGLKLGGVNGALGTINFQKLNLDGMTYLDAIQPQKPRLVMEYWSGWFDLWGGLHHVFTAEDIVLTRRDIQCLDQAIAVADEEKWLQLINKPEDMVAVVSEVLRLGASVNLYMFHGGTNFGFMNGAFAIGTPAPKPMVTSYAAPPPEVPSLQERRAYQPVVVSQHLSLWESLLFTDKPHRSERPVNMENLPVNGNNGQSYGYTLYETTVTSGGTLNSRNNVRDRALVFVDRQFVGVLDHKTSELALLDGKGERTLGLLVENSGRVNYGKTLDQQRKGLVGDIELNNRPLRSFIIHSLDMKPGFINRLQTSGHWRSLRHKPSFPGFFQARLYMDSPPRDTFIKLPGWSKGVVFINGQNLGRYWSIGPQQTLYLPAPWLHKGNNQVIVFEEQEADGKVQFSVTPDYGMTVDVQ